MAWRQIVHSVAIDRSDVQRRLGVCPGEPLGQNQNGIVTRGQLLGSGVSEKVIERQLRQGHWQRLYPGVYATFSGSVDPAALLWAAILRAGPDAALSYQTAAWLWELAPEPTGVIHVTVPSDSPVILPSGVKRHYSSRIAQACHPALSPPRTRVEETALDMAAASGSADDAVAWVLRAIASRRTTAGRIIRAMEQRRRMRWRAELSLALEPANAGAHSLLEFRYVARVERPHGLPAGARQRLIVRGLRHQYSDVEYERYATIVELDGRIAHSGPNRDLDIRRDNANTADGRVTLRYGWSEVSHRSCEVAAQIGQTLSRRGWPGPLRRCGSTCRLPSRLSRSA